MLSLKSALSQLLLFQITSVKVENVFVRMIVMDKANVIMESVDVILDIRENFARTLCVLIIVQLIKIIMKTE